MLTIRKPIGPVSQSNRMRPRSRRPTAPAASTPRGMSQRCTALQALYSRYTTRSKSTHVLSANEGTKRLLMAWCSGSKVCTGFASGLHYERTLQQRVGGRRHIAGV